MPEALARMRHDSVLTAPRRKAERGRAVRSPLRWLALAPRRPSAYAAAVLSATILGIIVNAVGLQHERHPAPFFTSPAPMSSGPAARSAPAGPATASAPPSAPAIASAPPAAPPMRPLEPAADPDPAPLPAARAADPIGDLLRTGGAKEASHMTVAAQSALIKLGYSLKADGAAGPDTGAALRDFEKSHNLPITTEITPRLVKLLTAAANSSTSR